MVDHQRSDCAMRAGERCRLGALLLTQVGSTKVFDRILDFIIHTHAAKDIRIVLTLLIGTILKPISVSFI